MREGRQMSLQRGEIEDTINLSRIKIVNVEIPIE